MRRLAPTSFAVSIFIGRWRLWLSLAWLPLVGVVVTVLLGIAADRCFDASDNCLLSRLPYGLAQVIETWHGVFLFALYGLCFIPAIAALYRGLLEAGSDRPWRVRLSGAELRYTGYHLALFYAGMIVSGSLRFWIWPRYLRDEADYPQAPDWFLEYFGHPVDCLIILLTLLALARFYLVLPHAALGRPGRFLELLAHSRGQVLAIVLSLVAVRILSIAVAAFLELPGWLVIELAELANAEAAQAARAAVRRATGFADDYVRAVGSAAVLAWFYRDRVLGREG